MGNPFADNIFWHDGLLLSCTTLIKDDKYCIEIIIELYTSNDSPKRKQFKRSFSGIKDFIFTMDMVTMNMSLIAGNICDCKIYKEEKRLFMYLTEGYLKFDFAEMKVVPLNEKACTETVFT